ncbi:MAG: hypothetical protein PHV20_05875 [Bacteroidales bacterium]|nr:hypothetical protein [Bacteroidales bacterium]
MNKIKRIYRWIRFRHGHGVHSPFAFSFINDIVEEKNIYYGYSDVETKIRLRKNYSTNFKKKSIKINQLYFRIGNSFRPNCVFSFGSQNPEAIFYLHEGCKAQIHSIFESNKKNTDNLLSIFETETKVRIHETVIDQIISKSKSEINKYGAPKLIYIDNSIDMHLKQNILNECCNFQHEETIIIIDGINDSKEMNLFWEKAIKNPSNTVSFDLLCTGIIIINRKLNKQDYKLFF